MDKFINIVGYETEIAELKKLRKFLMQLDMYSKIGIRVPRGVILYGSPGVGKTQMARAISNETIALVELKAADCTGGTATKAIQNAFIEAKAKAPCVLLLDELDKIAGGSDRFFIEDNNNVNKILLQELDQLQDNDGILVVATSNDLRSLGDALIRSGRFDRLIQIKRPTMQDRKKILHKYFSKIKLEQKFKLEYIAKITSGFSCADLECLANESGMLVYEEEKDAITTEIIRKVMNKLALHGSEGNAPIDINEKRKVATHEAGHILMALIYAPNSICGASILPQGNCAGFLQTMSDEGAILSIDDMEKQIAICLAGRVAEREILGQIYCGSSGDLSKAAQMAKQLVVDHAAYSYDSLICKFNDFRGTGVSHESLHNSEIQINPFAFIQLPSTVLVFFLLCQILHINHRCIHIKELVFVTSPVVAFIPFLVGC